MNHLSNPEVEFENNQFKPFLNSVISPNQNQNFLEEEKEFNLIHSMLTSRLEQVELENFLINVKTLNGTQKAIFCQKSMQVLELKQLIQEKLQVPVEEQRLIIGDKIMEQNHMTLEYYNVQKEQTIFLNPSYKGGCQYQIKLSYKDSKDVKLVEMNKTGSVFELKYAIAQKNHKTKQNIAKLASAIELKYMNRILSDSEILAQLDENEVIQVVSMTRNIQKQISYRIQGESKSVQIKLYQKVRELKEKIANENKLQSSNICLLLGDKRLEDHHTIHYYYGQLEKSEVRVEIVSGHVKMHNKQQTQDKAIIEKPNLKFEESKLMFENEVLIIIYLANYYTYEFTINKEHFKLEELEQYFWKKGDPFRKFKFQKDGKVINHTSELYKLILEESEKKHKQVGLSDYCVNSCIILHYNLEIEDLSPSKEEYNCQNYSNWNKQILFLREANDFEFSTEKVKEELIERLKVNKNLLSNFKDAKSIIINAYTSEPICKKIQDRLMVGQFQDLKYSLCELYRMVKSNANVSYKGPKELYRALSIRKHNYKEGDRMFWNCFTSTSLSLEVAEGFLINEPKNYGTIFFITVSQNKPYHNIKLKQSQNDGEEEVLLLPGFYFEVTKVEEEENISKVWVKEVPNQNLFDLDKYQFKKVLWYDESVFNEENIFSQEILIEQFPNLTAIDKMEILVSAVQALPECYLILQGNKAQKVLEAVHNLNQVKAVVIYTSQIEKYEELLKKYKKIKKICYWIDDVINELKQFDLSLKKRIQVDLTISDSNKKSIK